jgi:uncharacterized radical SAM superfamily Fe-S cluster-containing enzyme
MNEVLHETESLCPVCLKKIPARYERIDGKAYIVKHCQEHGEFKVLFWRDADMYAAWKRQCIPSSTGERPGDRAGMTPGTAVCAVRHHKAAPAPLF